MTVTTDMNPGAPPGGLAVMRGAVGRLTGPRAAAAGGLAAVLARLSWNLAARR